MNFLAQRGLLPGWSFLSNSLSDALPADTEFTKIWDDENGLAVVRRVGGAASEYFMVFGHDLVVRICFERREVSVTHVSPEVTDETLEHYMIDQVVPRVMSRDDALILHAGAVEHGGQALVLIGESGRGKSTLVGSLCQRGSRLMGDDAVAISEMKGQYRGEAVYPSLRLAPDSIDSLLLDPAHTTKFAYYSDKRRISVKHSGNHTEGSFGLKALYFLAPQEEHANVAKRRMTIAETCIGLVRHSFSLDPTDRIVAMRKLDWASAIAQAVPSYELSFPRDYGRLSEVCAAISGSSAS
jgi:hypothetical protein